ncbi:hypothetical protein [Protaetiibacter larvae]|uniref:Uncharacterized protein n=1 Tax=Protaetiibacter larvae TaxID=2592654 RepID=A0A5C1Y7D0_9MICO|nr:hypothetical protein [Protaetiibacter larvae]QEO08812.1 hypothetical protein FLP23_01525 [Protaetiibacter larvae]
MTLIHESLPSELPDALLSEFTATRVGFDCPQPLWDDDTSPFVLLEAALRAGGASGRLVRLVVAGGVVVGAERIESLLGRRIPARIRDAAARFAASTGTAAAAFGIDLVVDDGDRWWFGGATALSNAPITTPRRAPAGGS